MDFELILNYIFLLAMVLILYFNWRKLLPKMSENNKVEQFIDKHATKIVLLILLLFTLVKIYRLSELPYEHIDEQFLMYQVKSLLRIGTDMYGAEFPVYSRAWGWGMSMGYIYLACAFCKLFGVTYFTVRFPMLLIGTVAGWFVYLIGKNKSKWYGIMAVLVYCAIPYNFLAQRWALDRTLFPLIFIIAVYFAIEYFKEQKSWKLYASFILFGLSLYGYALGYIIVPVFLLFCLYYGIKNKKIRFKDTVGPVLILVLLALPLLLFVFNNAFGLIDIEKFLFFTIESAATDRSGEFGLYLNQLPDLFNLLLGRGTHANITIISSGIYYLFMIPFTLFGIASYLIKTIKKNSDIVDSLMSFLLLFTMLYALVVLDISDGKLNILMVIYPFLITEGIDFCFQKDFRLWVITMAMTAICFATSVGGYFANDGYLSHLVDELNPAGIEEVIHNIENNKEFEGRTVYLVSSAYNGSATLLNSADLTDEEMKTLEYVEFTHSYYGKSEAFTRVGRFVLLNFSKESPSYLNYFSEGPFELDPNGIYIVPNYKIASFKEQANLLEQKLFEIIENKYTNDLGTYNVYY